MTDLKFKLRDSFINKYKKIEPDFGFNGLGKIVYLRTYARLKPDGTKEQWYETVRRVVEGTYSIQKDHIEKYGLGWNEETAHESAEEMYDRLFKMKFLPAGRGLWGMGTKAVHEKKLFAALTSCAFYSTKDIDKDPTKPFEFMMDMSMLGVGVGFDTQGKDKLTVKEPKGEFDFTIPDTREGWVESLKLLLNAYLKGLSLPIFDYTVIRPLGSIIHTFGGTASGPDPLKKLHENIKERFSNKVGKKVNVTDIVDVMNWIGQCVVAGNVRRTAQIALGSYDNAEYLELKDYEWTQDEGYVGKNAHRASYGWTSNNSILAEVGMDYSKITNLITTNGEPGLFWLKNAQDYGRMSEPKNYKDQRAEGTNPCFSYNTLIKTNNGFKELGTLENKNPILINANGEKVRGKVWKTGTKDIIKLKYITDKTLNEIKCTPNHIFKDINDNEIKAKELKGKKIKPFYKEKSLSEIDNKWFSLGFIQGDGRTNPTKRQKTVTSIIGKKDGDVKKKLQTISYNELEELGFSKNPLPQRNLPTTFDMWSKEQQLDFISGLYTANGSVLKDYNRITLKTTNLSLAKKVQDFLSNINIKSYITTNKSKKVKFSNGIYICKESYDLNITGYRNILSFVENINFVQSYKRKKLIQILFNSSPTIQWIEEVGKEEVFDFSLSSNCHWGIIKDNFIVHNCGEQTLESGELCCLVETFITRADSLEDYKRTLKFAYLYAKTVTLGNTHWTETNRVMLRNRRIGTSISGIAQFVDGKGLTELKKWLMEGYDTIQYYDKIYSDWLAIPRSIKTTSIKPSGTVSLLAGVTPGVHFPESHYYIRRIRLKKNSELIEPLAKANYIVELDNVDSSSVVVEIPVHVNGARSNKEVSIWEKASLASFLQRYWADNQVSCTISFNENERNEIRNVLNHFQYYLKGISFLPMADKGKYEQMPYEEISKEKYEELASNLKTIKFKEDLNLDAKPELYCDGDTCTIL